MGLILAFITYIGWGTGDIFGIFASRKVGAYITTVYVGLFGFLVASLYIPFAIQDFFKITLGLLLLNILFGTAIMFGNFLLNEGFRRSNASLVGIIVQCFPAVVLVLSALIWKDPITPKQIWWIILIFAGVTIATIDFNDLKKRQLFSDVGVRLALGGAFIFSLYFTFFRVFSNEYGWFWPNYISIASFPIALLLAKKIFKSKDTISKIPHKSVLIATFLSAVFLRGGDIALNSGLSSGYASIVAPIAGASPTLFLVLASIFYKDPITTQQKIGIGISLVGIVLLSFFSH